MNRKIEQRAEDSLPPDAWNARVAAELSFEIQGGCADIVEVYTTDGGKLLLPMPDNILGFDDIRSHLQSVLEVNPEVSSASCAYLTSDSLCCLYMTRLPRIVLHVMEAPITGPRTLGEWSIEKIIKARADNVLPRVIAALRQCRHSFLSVCAKDNSERTVVLFGAGESVYSEINGGVAEPEETLEKMLTMVDANIDGGPDLVVTAIDEGDCQEGSQPKAVWGIGYIGGMMVPVEPPGFKDLASLFALSDEPE